MHEEAEKVFLLHQVQVFREWNQAVSDNLFSVPHKKSITKKNVPQEKLSYGTTLQNVITLGFVC